MRYVCIKEHKKMIGHQQKGRKRAPSAKLSGVNEIGPVKKLKPAGEGGMSYNPEPDKFSADQFIPDKHKQAETRLANSLSRPHF